MTDLSDVTTMGWTVRVSRQVALDLGLIEPTPAEAAERARQVADYRRREAAHTDAMVVWRSAWATALPIVACPAVTAALTLHTETEDGYCSACTGLGDGAYTDWPCETVTVMAAAAGVPVPQLEAPA